MSLSASHAPVEPFAAYVRRRGASATVMTPGEVVTAAVGLLRGCRRAAGQGGGASWWLTADGRPVVVEEDDAPDVVAATADSFRRLAALIRDPTTRDLVDRAGETVATRPPREWDAVERRLFAHAEPAPLVLGPLVPVAVEEPEATPADEPARGLTGLVDDELLGMVRRHLAGLGERWRTSPPFLTTAIGASVIAAVAVVASVLVPVSREPAPVASSSPSLSQTSPLTATIAPLPSATSPWPVDDRVPLSDDVIAIARGVFSAISLCADDPTCRSRFDEGSAFQREPLLPDAEHADIALLEDFGGVVVVRITHGSTTQYVTLVRQNDRWLVRAVETVADQPS